jgi:hypothetical protein
MCTVLLPSGVKPTTFNKYIMPYHTSYISYHKSCNIISYHIVHIISRFGKNRPPSPMRFFSFSFPADEHRNISLKQAMSVSFHISCSFSFMNHYLTRSRHITSQGHVTLRHRVTSHYVTGPRHITSQGHVTWTFRTLLYFKLTPCSECCTISLGLFPGVWILCADVSEHPVCSIFIGRVNISSCSYTVPRTRMSGSKHILPFTPLQRGKGQLYFCC